MSNLVLGNIWIAVTGVIRSARFDHTVLLVTVLARKIEMKRQPSNVPQEIAFQNCFSYII